jgi:Ca2+/H+ antiporter, TMEM165/GDT1 family
MLALSNTLFLSRNTLMTVATDDRASQTQVVDTAPVVTVIEPEPQDSAQDALTVGQELKIFLSTFLTILAAEVGDKTQLTTLLMSAESQSPWIVFLGAGSALVATSLIGVLVGRWLATRVSPRVLETSVGCLLLLIAVLLVWDVANL